MADKRWSGKSLQDLLTKSAKEISGEYGVTEDYAVTQKYRVIKRIKKRIERMERDPSYLPTQEHLDEMETLDPERVREMLKEFKDSGMPVSEEDADQVEGIAIWQMGYKDEEGEARTQTLRSVRFKPQKPGSDPTDFISQADPIRITPSKRKPAKRDHKIIVAFSDNQIDYREQDGIWTPIHDERVMEITRLICKHYQPDTIVNLGDTIDLAALSRFPTDSNHFNHSMKPAFNRVHRMYAELRADNPNARIAEVDSNHNDRLKKFLLKNFPQAFDLQQAGNDSPYPVLSYPFLTNLEEVGVDWFGGYGAAEMLYGEEYGRPPIVFKHGISVVSNGSTMAKEAKENPYTHVVRGHGHRMESFYQTNRYGDYLGYIMLGASCSTHGEVPSYHSGVNEQGHVIPYQENWQNGILIIEDYDGEYVFNHVPIRNGKAHYQGLTFEAE